MSSRRQLTGRNGATRAKFTGLAMIVIAAGLGTGLAIPEVLNNLHQAKGAPVDSRSVVLPRAAPNKAAFVPPILAVLDPSTLVEDKSQPANPESLPLPVRSTALTLPAPRTTATALEPDPAQNPAPARSEGPDFESEILLPGSPQKIWTPEPASPRMPATAEFLVEPGDTLIEILVDGGATRRDAVNAIAALSPLFNIRRLRVGQKISITTAPAGEDQWQLSAISLMTDVDREVRVSRSDDGGFTGQERITELSKGAVFTGGEITSSLYLAAERDGIPANTTVDLIRVFSFGVDFQREIHPGDSYQVLYETFSDETGVELKQGALLYALLRLGARNMALYRFEGADGFADYYNEKGQSIKRLLMRTPIDGARLSSSFGNRRHPILGYTKLHTGTDFAAPRGTPIMAAGNGVLEHAGRKGGYGIYIRIRHNGTYATAYAHMSRLARGMKKGKRVSQGQVIGYVGTTGRSTGNHLHYEVRQNGKPVNPMGLRLPVGRELKGKDLEAFRRQVAKVRQMIDDLSPPLSAAATPAPQALIPRAKMQAASFTAAPSLGKGR